MEETLQNASSGASAAVVNNAVNAENNRNLAPELLAPKGYLPFVEARHFAVSLNLKTRKEWRTYVKGDMPNTTPKPANIPAHPDGIYKVKGWQGWKFWLGTADVGLPQRPQMPQ